jgi:hypothetical protein
MIQIDKIKTAMEHIGPKLSRLMANRDLKEEMFVSYEDLINDAVKEFEEMAPGFSIEVSVSITDEEHNINFKVVKSIR